MKTIKIIDIGLAFDQLRILYRKQFPVLKKQSNEWNGRLPCLALCSMLIQSAPSTLRGLLSALAATSPKHVFFFQFPTCVHMKFWSKHRQ